MAAFVKYQCSVEVLVEGNAQTDVFKIALTNTAPNVATHTVLADITEIAAGNGYTAGGATAATSSSGQTGGLYKLILADPATWTATGGAMAPFRYAVLYNSTTGRLIGYWDYGLSITLGVGETFLADLDAVAGVLQLS